MERGDRVEILKPSEVATRLRVSRKTVGRLIDNGVLPALRAGRVIRISATAVETVLNRRAEALQ